MMPRALKLDSFRSRSDLARSRRGSGRRCRKALSPRLEGLEDRQLLSLSIESGSGAARISPGWFQRLSSPAGDGQPLESRIGRIVWGGRPVDAVKDEWIVQLTDSASVGMRGASDAVGLFASSPIQLEVVS